MLKDPVLLGLGAVITVSKGEYLLSCQPKLGILNISSLSTLFILHSFIYFQDNHTEQVLSYFWLCKAVLSSNSFERRLVLGCFALYNQIKQLGWAWWLILVIQHTGSRGSKFGASLV